MKSLIWCWREPFVPAPIEAAGPREGFASSSAFCPGVRLESPDRPGVGGERHRPPARTLVRSHGAVDPAPHPTFGGTDSTTENPCPAHGAALAVRRNPSTGARKPYAWPLLFCGETARYYLRWFAAT